MPPLSQEFDAYQDRGSEFFAFLPVKTATGWAWLTDCVEIWRFDCESGWSMHFEKLHGG